MGNILNRSKATAFRVEVLEKLSGVRDTVNRKSLLHHVVSRCTRSSLVGELITIFLRRCLELQPNLGNLLLELKDLGLVARTDYEELLTNLSRMEVLLKCSQLF